MLPSQIIWFLWTFVVSFLLLLLPKPSEEARIEDCIKGKQYWSASEHSFIPGKDGVCIACPPNWLTCYHQPIDDKERCVDSCRGTPEPSSSSKHPSTTSFIPHESLQSKVTSSLTTSTVYTLPRQPVDVKKAEEENRSNNEGSDQDLALIVAISALCVFVVIAVVALLFVFRTHRRRSQRAQSRVERGNGGDVFCLQEIRRNEEGGSQLDNEGEQRGSTEPNNAGERSLQANDEEQCLLQDQNNGESRLPTSDTGNRLAVQETQGPAQATPSERNISGIEVTEEDNFSSSFHLNHVHS